MNVIRLDYTDVHRLLLEKDQVWIWIRKVIVTQSTFKMCCKKKNVPLPAMWNKLWQFNFMSAALKYFPKNGHAHPHFCFFITTNISSSAIQQSVFICRLDLINNCLIDALYRTLIILEMGWERFSFYCELNLTNHRGKAQVGRKQTNLWMAQTSMQWVSLKSK